MSFVLIQIALRQKFGLSCCVKDQVYLLLNKIFKAVFFFLAAVFFSSVLVFSFFFSSVSVFFKATRFYWFFLYD